MCGRFSIEKAQADLEHYFRKDMPAGYSGPNYNVAPTQIVPVLTAEGFENMRWGLVPQWAKSMSTGYTMINAVGETLMEKRTYSGPLKKQRCVVPATGFYEWLTTPAGKLPYYFHLKSREIFGFAGLFVERKYAEVVVMKSFTIITTTPNSVVEPVHSRMPVILRQEDEAAWLDEAMDDGLDAMSFIGPYDASDMEKYRVGKEVGNVANNGPELVKESIGD